MPDNILYGYGDVFCMLFLSDVRTRMTNGLRLAETPLLCINNPETADLFFA